MCEGCFNEPVESFYSRRLSSVLEEMAQKATFLQNKWGSFVLLFFLTIRYTVPASRRTLICTSIAPLLVLIYIFLAYLCWKPPSIFTAQLDCLIALRYTFPSHISLWKRSLNLRGDVKSIYFIRVNDLTFQVKHTFLFYFVLAIRNY